MRGRWEQVNRIPYDRENDEVWHLITYYKGHDLIHVKVWPKNTIRVAKDRLEKTCIRRIKIKKGSFNRRDKSWIPLGGKSGQWKEGALPYKSAPKSPQKAVRRPKVYW